MIIEWRKLICYLFTDQIIDGTIDLDPEYQRGAYMRTIRAELVSNRVLINNSPDIVWGEAKQSGLIDSILRNFYMPPVIFGG